MLITLTHTRNIKMLRTSLRTVKTNHIEHRNKIEKEICRKTVVWVIRAQRIKLLEDICKRYAKTKIKEVDEGE